MKRVLQRASEGRLKASPWGGLWVATLLLGAGASGAPPTGPTPQPPVEQPPAPTLPQAAPSPQAAPPPQAEPSAPADTAPAPVAIPTAEPASGYVVRPATEGERPAPVERPLLSRLELTEPPRRGPTTPLVAQRLAAARAALAGRDVASAGLETTRARAAVVTVNDAAEVDRVERVVTLVAGFWRGVAAGAQRLKPGARLNIAGEGVTVDAADVSGFTYRTTATKAGQAAQSPRSASLVLGEVEAEVATALAGDAPRLTRQVAAFWLFDRQRDVGRARLACAEAQRRGCCVDDLTVELPAGE